MKLCESSVCTGCLACVNSCPKMALSISKDDEGFYVPSLLVEKCIECGTCERSCPILNVIEKKRVKQYGYAIWSRNKILRKESSSGGIFSELALYILKSGGVVFGAAFTSNFTVSHIMIDKEDDLAKLRGSKYLQSNIHESYKAVRSVLKEGRMVLFSGAPCQVAGLYGYLQRDYSNLVTCDFVCHGVPSPNVFLKYKEWLENCYKSSFISYTFRDKRNSWSWYNTKAIFESGEVYFGNWFKDPFIRLFLRDNILRKSCYQCRFANMERVSDITLADFWGYVATCKEEKNTDEGISMLLINTSKGRNLVDLVKNQTICFERDSIVISKSQKSLSSTWNEPVTRSEFWLDFQNMNFDEIIAKWGYPERRNFPQYLISEYGSNTVVKSLCWVYYRINIVFFKLISFFNRRFT